MINNKKINKKIYFFIGTNAEFIKIAPVLRELRRRKAHFKIIVTGQNQINFAELVKFTGHIKPDASLGKKPNKFSIFHFIFWTFRTLITTLSSLGKEFKSLNNDNSYFIIHGDTVSSSIGALAAKWYGLKLVRIEAGYFSNNLLEPFPEELSRRFNSFLSDIEFPSTDWTANNLRNYHSLQINTKFNTIIETMQWALKQKVRPNLNIKGRYYLMIMHRQEHVIFRKNWTKKIMEFVINNTDKELTCIILNHPLAIKIIKDANLDSRIKIKLISPLPYLEFIKLMEKSEFLASDGSTFQQETFYMGKPFLILRNYTEQTEGLNKNAVLCKSNSEIIKNFLVNYQKYKTAPIYTKVSPSKIIVDYLLSN